ncbi:hypothetical protein [Salinimicrobium sediminilitoris]|uniref:hypothetical protein n=1 Tax=Salinimicrobium sediminilitoris TaxID=2876715 RepID=UPI001E3D5DE1|nr:hypothetical protein [Salinimicrobium sediminilitoris]MCC8360621.1 hypothetical protein [Salinimicrobium sediminilitoris]
MSSTEPITMPTTWPTTFPNLGTAISFQTWKNDLTFPEEKISLFTLNKFVVEKNKSLQLQDAGF